MKNHVVYEWFQETSFIEAGNAVLLCYLHLEINSAGVKQLRWYELR